MKTAMWILLIILLIFSWLLERRIQKKESQHQKDIFNMMVKTEVDNWFHKENLDRMTRGLEPLKRGGGSSMRKICVVVASRANWGRLKSVVKSIREHPNLELQVIVAASACELPIEANAKIQCLIDGDNTEAMALTTGIFLTQIAGVLSQLKPDIVFVHGDRYEILAVAIAASYMNIPLAHTEGGETTGTIDEKVRHAVSKLADIHFPVTSKAEAMLALMGCENIFTVGSTALDTIKDIDLSNGRAEPYIVILHHPNTTDPEDITPLIDAVKSIPLKKVWVNPNVDAGNKAMLKLIHKQDVEFVKNLSPEEYARLIYNSECLVGNTSSGIKEGAFLGVPFVCVGNRQTSREIGHNTILVNMDKQAILHACNAQIDHGRYKPDYRFGDGTAGQKIANILAEVNL